MAGSDGNEGIKPQTARSKLEQLASCVRGGWEWDVEELKGE